MGVGDLVALRKNESSVAHTLYSLPGVFRAEQTGRAVPGNVFVVIETMDYLDVEGFFVRVLGPEGCGWINSVYFVLVSEFQKFID